LNSLERHLFNLLKAAVETTFLENNKASSSIKDWKGEEIVAFQEDLFNKVKGKVSEKWFYTYIKKSPEKLPRIDVLNLLSDYVGHTNWTTFKSNNRSANISVPKKKGFLKYGALIVFLLILTLYYYLTAKNTFEFCFVDAIKNEIITSIPLDIILLQNNESPIHYKTDSLGCFSFKTKNEVIRFVVPML